MKIPRDFGEWTSADEHLDELTSRLLAWQMTGNDLPTIFDAACRRYERLTSVTIRRIGTDPENLFKHLEDADSHALLAAFDEALNDLDELLRASNELEEDSNDSEG